MRKATPQTLERVFDLKRELIEVRRAISPVREVFNQLTNRDMPLIDDDEIVYFRDVYDHLIRLTDELDMYRELAAATLDVYLTQVNNNLSVIMKRLTGVTVILAGIGAVAGIFGMSEASARARRRRGRRVLDRHRGRRRWRPAAGLASCAGSTGSEGQPQTSGCGFGCAAGDRRPPRTGSSAMTWVLPGVPLRALRRLEPELLGRRP